MRIRPTVHQMAGFAAIHLHRRVLVNKRPLLVDMALEADLVLCGRGPQLVRFHGSMRVVAIGALHQTLVHAMVEGHVEFGLLRQVTRVAKLRLRLDEQKI